MTTKKNSVEYIKPIIKWVGGKTQIIDKVLELFPDKMDNYHELFLGGGSVLLGFLTKVKNKDIIVKKNIYAYDFNETLIYLYKNIQTKCEEIIMEIDKIINEYNTITNNIINRKATTIDEAKTSKESYYYWIRQKFNDLEQSEKNKPLGSAYFIFLNKTSFRGVYREGPNGFNVPYGHYKNPEIINREHIKKISDLIKNVNFIHSDFEDSFENIKKNDFIYLDPPYVPETSTSFVGYTSDGFALEKHQILFESCKKYNFLMSNSDVDLVKDSFSDKNKYIINIVSCKRSINSKKPNSKTNEVLIKSK